MHHACRVKIEVLQKKKIENRKKIKEKKKKSGGSVQAMN